MPNNINKSRLLYLPSLATQTEEHTRLAEFMLELAKKANELQQFTANSNLQRKQVCWMPVGSMALESFPRMNEDDLRTITCGVY